jgi:RNA polymerase sigma factor (sigma-70 family)
VERTGSAASVDSEAERLAARFHRPLMSFFLRRLQDRDEAEDLTQEVFLRILRRDEAVPLDNPAIYIFRVAANLLRDRARRAATHHAAEHASLDAPQAEFTDTRRLAIGLVEDREPERVLLSQESLKEVMRALDELGDRTRDIFMLSRLEKMKHRDIAALYGITVSAVEKHLSKASLHLARKFGPL